MKPLFEPAIGYIVLEYPEDEVAPKLHLSKELREKRILEQALTWKVLASHEVNAYKVGDELILHPDAKNVSMKLALPIEGGLTKTFLMTTTDVVMGKILKEEGNATA